MFRLIYELAELVHNKKEAVVVFVPHLLFSV